MSQLEEKKEYNGVIFRKSFDDYQKINDEARQTICNFILLIDDEIKRRYSSKKNEYDKVKKFLDYDIKLDFKSILQCYKNTLEEINKNIEEIIQLKDFTPADCFLEMQKIKSIITRSLFNPLKNIESESNFIHKLKNIFNKFSTFIEKISFGNINFGFFKPKPSYNDTIKIITEVENVENAINMHFGIQI